MGCEFKCKYSTFYSEPLKCCNFIELSQFSIEKTSFETYVYILKKTHPLRLHCDEIKSSSNTIKLTNIDMDCQLLIFEELDLFGLLNMAKINQNFKFLASEVFRRKFGVKLFVFLPTWNVIGDAEVGIETTRVLITSADLAEKLLKMFGYLIPKISIVFGRTDLKFDDRQIVKIINECCSESLVHLELDVCSTQMWEGVRKPFVNVQNLTFRNVLQNLQVINLNEIFPHIRRLELHNVNPFDGNTFDHRFFHLEHLSIGMAGEMKHFSKSVEQMIRKNPQIRSVSLESSWQFLKVLSEYLPQLDTLELLSEIQSNLSNEDQDLRFDSVRKVHMKCTSWNVPTITFGSMQEFILEIRPELTESWIAYIKQHQHLRKIRLIEPVLNGQIIKLSEGLSNLIEASFNCGSDVTAETIINFIEKNSQMEKLRLTIPDEPLRNILKTELQPGRFNCSVEVLAPERKSMRNWG